MEQYVRLDVKSEKFTGHVIQISKIIIIPYLQKEEILKLDLTPVQVNIHNWIDEYKKALYRDAISRYYLRDPLLKEDLAEVYYIHEGHIILVLDDDGHFLGKINYNIDKERNLMQLMYLYVCGKRRDLFYKHNIKKYPRGAIIIWTAAAIYSSIYMEEHAKILITYPRFSVLKYLKQCQANFVELKPLDENLLLIFSIPVRQSKEEIKKLTNKIYSLNLGEKNRFGAMLKLKNLLKILHE